MCVTETDEEKAAVEAAFLELKKMVEENSATRRAEIEAELWKLPIQEGVQVEHLIPIMAGRLLMLDFSKPRPKKAHKKALKELEKAAESFADAIGSLPSTAREALNFNKEKLPELTSLSRILGAAARIAAKESGGKKGAPSKEHAAAVTRSVGHYYFMLTGRKPAPASSQHDDPNDEIYEGLFIPLLRAIFKLLEFPNSVSARSQANILSTEWGKKVG